MTQGTVASVLGVTADTVSNYERGRTEPSIADLSRLAALYGVTVDYLVRGPRPEVRRCSHGVPVGDRCMTCELASGKVAV